MPGKTSKPDGQRRDRGQDELSRYREGRDPRRSGEPAGRAGRRRTHGKSPKPGKAIKLIAREGPRR